MIKSFLLLPVRAILSLLYVLRALIGLAISLLHAFK